MPVSKPLTEHFEHLPEAIKQKALYNTPQMLIDDGTAYTLPEAIESAFVWHKTPEGRNFWKTVYTIEAKRSKAYTDLVNNPLI